MYDGCFGLNRRPFASVPQIDHYFPATTIEAARATLVRCIQRGEGTGLVIGPSGTGKTLLCLMLAEQFRNTFQVAMLSTGRLSTRRALFQAMLYELGRPYRGMDEGEARLAVIDYLMSDESASCGVVLLVDEAHTLPLRLLDEIRLLTNLVRGGQPLVRAVLAGGPSLEERFASPKLDSFSQRLGARCYLESHNRTETEAFIQSQIDAAGGNGALFFPKDVCQSVFQATGGVPRLINQLCDHALLLAYVAGRRQIEPVNIEEAWADLQQLPTPWSGETKTGATAGGVIEFGSLDDQPESASTTGFAPSLRVASGEDEEATEAEPSQRLHRIEKLLAEADDEFEPAGSIGPEVELCFEGPVHPFQEEFEHEEIVADRYGQAKASPVFNKPVAASYRPKMAPPPAPVTPVTEEEQLKEIAVSADDLVRTVLGEEDELAKTPGFSESYEIDFASQEEEPSESTVSETTLNFREESLAICDAAKQAAIPMPAAETPTTPARPREYRQLFARLRRID